MKPPIAVLTIPLFSSLLLSSRPANVDEQAFPRGKSYTKSIQGSRATSSLAQAVERQLTNIEQNIISCAEAMPEDKFGFTPETLRMAGCEFHGVRTFAGQVKHLATDNFAIWTPLTGATLRADITDVNGPVSIQTKSAIIQYLKESFAVGHRAIETLTQENAMELIPFRGSALPRLDLAFYALTHSNEHYGQMVVYLRMCGIIPPASRPTPKN